MSERHLLTLDRDTSIRHWYVLDDGQLLTEGTGNDLSGLLNRTASQLVAIIPGEEVVIRWVSIPGKNNRQRFKAASYAIEDFLASDLEDMHFSFKAETGSDRIQVLAISKERLENYLTSLASVGIDVDVLTTDTSLLEAPPDSIAVMHLADDRYLINDGQSQWPTDASLAEAQITLLQSPDQQKPLLYWSNQPASGWLSALDFELHTETVADPWLSLLSRFESSSPNLLTGSYARRSDMNAFWQQWKRPIQYSIGLVLIQLIYMAVELAYLTTKRNDLKTEVTALYHQVAPGARVVDARRQMQQLINQGQGARLDSNSFQLMLQGLSTAVSSGGGVETTNLNYSAQTSELRVDLLAKNLSQLDKLKQALEQSGYEVTMGGATAQGNQYSGRLIMRSR